MALDKDIIQKQLSEKFGENVSDFRMEVDILTFHAHSEYIKDIIRYMKEDAVLRFNFLTDLCGVHYPDNEPDSRFAVVYHLHNWLDNVRVRIKTFLSDEKTEVDTISDVFAAANWQERETYDFFGIIFKGHPNLKRILNDDAMTVFPMRKDYPLEDSGRSDKDDRFFGRTTNNYQPTEK